MGPKGGVIFFPPRILIGGRAQSRQRQSPNPRSTYLSLASRLNAESQQTGILDQTIQYFVVSRTQRLAEHFDQSTHRSEGAQRGQSSLLRIATYLRPSTG